MKTVKFVKIDKRIYYPVGDKISENLIAIKDMVKLLKELYPDKQLYLWCRGSSGAIIAGVIATQFKRVVICHVKKEGESAHSDFLPSVSEDGVNVIVDDFIGMGTTVNEVYKAYNQRTGNININCLCITGKFRMSCLSFMPETIISQGIYNEYDNDSIVENCEFVVTDSKFIIKVRKQTI